MPNRMATKRLDAGQATQRLRKVSIFSVWFSYTPVCWQTLCVLALVGSLAPTAATQPHQRGRSQVVLAWEYDQPAPPIDGFLVERRTGTGPWQEVGRVGATLRTFTDSTAALNTPLCYQVHAYRGQEQSSASNEVCLTIPTATQPPTPPRPGGRVPRRRTAS